MKPCTIESSKPVSLVNNSVTATSQIETSTSQHAIETTIKSAVVADDTPLLFRIQNPADAMPIHTSSKLPSGFCPNELKFSPRRRPTSWDSTKISIHRFPGLFEGL